MTEWKFCWRKNFVALMVVVVAAMMAAAPPASRAQVTVAADGSAHGHGDIAGDWQGTLEIPGREGRPGGKYRIVLRIAKTVDGLSALNYVIDQSPTPMKTAAVTLRGTTFQYSIPAMNGSYTGEMSADGKSIVGEWTQGTALPLVFVRATKEAAWEIPKPLPPLKPMAADADPSFEVATLKPSAPDGSGKVLRVMGRRYVTRNTSLADLIEVAYGVHPRQIKGAPGWIEEDKFDLVGVPDAEGEPNARQWLTMMQKLLADRFKLTFHHEKQEISAFVISVGKNGPKNLTKNESGNALPSGLEFRLVAGGLLLPGGNTSMATLAQMMQQVVLDRPVIDKTGLAGNFDFQLTFAPDETQFNGHPPAVGKGEGSLPGLSEAMQEELGLKLSAEKVLVDVLVVDRVEKPSGN